MRHGQYLVVIVALVSRLYLPDAFACEGLQPYGVLRWDDTLVEVLLKLNRMASIQHVTLLDEHRGSVDLLGLRTREALLNQIALFLARSQAQYQVGRPHEKIFIDTLIIGAEPIMIFGVPFSFHIAYSPAPDMLTGAPDRVLTLHDTNGTYALPLRMMHVVVTKVQTSVLHADTLQRLKTAMATKYQACAVFRMDEEEMFARDNEGRAFLARWKAAEAFRDVEPGYTGSGLLQYRNK